MTENYYGPQAYRSDRVPEQKRQVADPGRSWFNRKFDMRLPWGRTEEVAPLSFRKRFRPEVLRKIESKPSGFENIDFHQRIDHEKYRHSTPAFRTNFFNILSIFGKATFLLMFPLFLVTSFIALWHVPAGMSLEDFGYELLGSVRYFFGIPLGVWCVGKAPFVFFPQWVIKPSKGPKWELNRRTGLVTVYHDRKGSSEEEQAPFYEFDAYLTNEMIPPGQVVHTLYLVHRYRPILLPIGNLIGKTTGEECFALWDMFQNFMDTSRPLPDIPLWEEFRSKDPITAEHDRQTGRPARYWRDMDDETWKQKESEMMSKVRSLTTPYRPNLMRQHVRYVS
ncbi:hypothetical protein EZI54_15350 [Marinobacter halodurans]|uniref:Uncharacterized protein n=1 Tax=Marinobacter halodurans TaxID=2528979 RepID=A0ABY1ZK96_9GAMM|nr:hypothetical protein [Marinobacter halodurans]TBW53356.1 hypothetical protein EZI54_15350 [Marinobacter halodurans]